MADQPVDGPEVGYGLVQSRLQTGLGGDIARAAARHGPSRAERARGGHGRRAIPVGNGDAITLHSKGFRERYQEIDEWLLQRAARRLGRPEMSAPA